MTMTKSAARSMIKELLDDTSASSVTLMTSTNLDLLTSMVIDELASDAFEVDPWFKILTQTIASADIAAPGTIDLRSTSASGKLTQRLQRLLLVTRNGRHYIQYHPTNILIEDAAALVAPDYTYIILGDKLHLFPYDTQADVELTYSHKPTAYTSLADGVNVDWPEGHEGAFIYETAARAIAKGDREDSTQLRMFADKSWHRFMSYVKRRKGYGATQPYDTMSPHEFGGI